MTRKQILTHQKEIIAWANGKQIEYSSRGNSWKLCNAEPNWAVDTMYRVALFIYPLYMKEITTGIIVKFHDLTKGVVVCGNGGLQSSTGFTWHCFTPHTRLDRWEPTTFKEIDNYVEPILYYKWKKLNIAEDVIEVSPYTSTVTAMNYNYKGKGWTRIESSKTTFEGLK